MVPSGCLWKVLRHARGLSIASSDQASQSLLVNDRLLGTAPAEDQTCSLWRPTTRTVAPNFVCGSSFAHRG